MFFRKLLFLISLSFDRRQVSIASCTLRVKKNAIQGVALSQRTATLRKYEQVVARREIQVHRTKRDKTDGMFEMSGSPSSNSKLKTKTITTCLFHTFSERSLIETFIIRKQFANAKHGYLLKNITKSVR